MRYALGECMYLISTKYRIFDQIKNSYTFFIVGTMKTKKKHLEIARKNLVRLWSALHKVFFFLMVISYWLCMIEAIKGVLKFDVSKKKNMDFFLNKIKGYYMKVQSLGPC